jgi:hypothetical protein
MKYKENDFLNQIEDELMTKLPLNFNFIQELTGNPFKSSFIENYYYRTKLFSCEELYKPISKIYNLLQDNSNDC